MECSEIYIQCNEAIIVWKLLPTLDLLSKIMPKETATKLTMRLLQIRQLFVDAFNSIFNFAKEIGKN